MHGVKSDTDPHFQTERGTTFLNLNMLKDKIFDCARLGHVNVTANFNHSRKFLLPSESNQAK